eukprot:Phypoly_transcript_05411.p1 GENE.Phypoly_transcript_05411~~Phypoly_transcript_05411.p1  ORF type:complete len:505 (+),score=83.92 Phypoly_transcript_05411:341-1855(+)
MSGKHHLRKEKNYGDPRECWTSFDLAEARQFPKATEEKDVQEVRKWIESENYVVETSVESGDIKLICARGKGSFSVIPYVLFKSEEFTGTSIITLATWGKIRSRAAVAGTVSLGTSVLGAVPSHLHLKSHAKKFLNNFFGQLDDLLGNGHTVASPFAPEEAQDPIWANPQLANPSLAELHNMQPVIHTNPAGSKERFKKVAERGLDSAEVVEGINVAAESAGYPIAEAVLGTGAAGMEVAGDVLPFIGVGFGYGLYRTAHNKSQTGSAVGLIVGSASGIPLAGLLGSQIGKAVGKKADGKPTSVEETETIIWNKKKEALRSIGINPPAEDHSKDQQNAPIPKSNEGQTDATHKGWKEKLSAHNPFAKHHAENGGNAIPNNNQNEINDPNSSTNIQSANLVSNSDTNNENQCNNTNALGNDNNGNANQTDTKYPDNQTADSTNGNSDGVGTNYNYQYSGGNVDYSSGKTKRTFKKLKRKAQDYVGTKNEEAPNANPPTHANTPAQ